MVIKRLVTYFHESGTRFIAIQRNYEFRLEHERNKNIFVNDQIFTLAIDYISQIPLRINNSN